VLARKFASVGLPRLKLAVRLSVPAGSDVTFRVAIPLESVLVPRTVLPLKKVMSSLLVV